MNKVESTLGERKGAIQYCLTPEMVFYKVSLSSEQERWQSHVGNKPQNFEQLSIIPSFQDRRSKLSNRLVATDLLQQSDYTCKIDLKDAYFSVPLQRSSQS